MSQPPVIEHLHATWASILGVCDELRPDEWDLPTDCPGWSVRDQVSHLIGVESMLAGREAPPAVAGAPHIKNPVGERNEAWVGLYRDRPGAEVLAEFRELAGLRLAALRAMTDEQLDAEINGPVGRQPYRDFLQVRLLDSWVHEQDIRRATGRPGHLDGPAAEAVVDRLASSLPFIVGKKAGAPDGTVVVVHIEGPVARTLAVGVEGGRARVVDGTPVDPVVTLTVNTETFVCLAGGRWSASQALDGGGATIAGDVALGRTILEEFDVVP